METSTQAAVKPATTTVEGAPKIASGGEINAQSPGETDGFQLVIDSLKLNGIDKVFGLPGITITDFTRKCQAAGMRVISFRHEQNAGYAASIAGFMTKKPGVCLT
ncbi:MAG: thiamine pyrophosphate-binding protein, partial [Bradyrhizobium sp.]